MTTPMIIETKMLKGIDEGSKKILETILEKIGEQGAVEWNKLNSVERAFLRSYRIEGDIITINDINWIVNQLKENSNKKDNPNQLFQEKYVPENNFPEKVIFPPISKVEISNREISSFSAKMEKNGTMEMEMEKNGTIFYETLINAILRTIDLDRPKLAIGIAALYLLPPKVDGQEAFHQKDVILKKAEEINKKLGDKYSSSTIRQVVSTVLNKEAFVDYKRSENGYRLIDSVRDDITKKFIEVWEQEMAKAELEARSITERETTIRAFVNFFRHYVDDNNKKIYLEAIEDLLVKDPSKSLEIDFTHLNAFHPELAEALLEYPEDVISAAEDAIQIILMEDLSVEELFKIHARFYNLPKTLEPRFVGPEHINKFIQVRGIITRLSSIEPFVSRAVFLCRDCGHAMARLQKPYSARFVKPPKCEDCGSRELELDPDNSTFLKYQSSIIQDQPEKLKGGQMPRQLHMVFLEDLCDNVIPGDRVVITGILRMVEEARDTRPVKRIVFIANHIEKESKDVEDIKITHEEEQRILEEVKSSDFKEKLIDSFAPTIHGYRKEKFGILLSLFGGEDDYSPTGEQRRRRIHVLLVGDPSTAKSHLLDFTAQVAPRAVKASGKGVSGVGLTAAANRDELTGKWTVDAGTLVLADQGFAILDELDKMSKNDRDNLHEPMEQGRIDFAKAGINMVLNARATVIAAANPKLGRFNPMRSVPEQIDLPPTLFSRFDLIFMFVDEPDQKRDLQVAEAFLERWYKPEEVRPPYSPEFLQKIIAYARRKIKNLKMTEEAYKYVKEQYAKLRNAVKKSGDNGPIPFTPRQLGAMVRLAEAYARMHLRDTVTLEDVKVAKELIKYTLRKVAMDEEGNLDVSIIEVGKSAKEIDRERKILDIIKELQELEEWGASRDEVIKEARRYDISENMTKTILERLLNEGRIYIPRGGYYKLRED